ncbi:unnamed protein product [Fraxinus pennsylvanica]|uniref:DhaL domain-containing protein n=1 Tax=Fraxinus pennsylvanica TaxID=56036 RepID=A0AAD1ZX25_9LAMI|nr:unnamed protein product [Fraxinus pennsylvanica]
MIKCLSTLRSHSYRTLLDALIPALSVLKEKLTAGDDPVEAFVLSAEAVVAGAESTKHMLFLVKRNSKLKIKSKPNTSHHVLNSDLISNSFRNAKKNGDVTLHLEKK